MSRLFPVLAAGLILSATIHTVGKAETAVALKTIKLPKPAADGTVSLEKAVGARRSARNFADKPLTLAQASQLLWAAQGITETKKGLRAAPSAGACYPISLYLLAGRVDGLDSGTYLYLPAGHLLMRKASADARADLARASLGQTCVGQAPTVLALAADHGRIKPRYGDRAARYADMEAGHIGQNVALQAAALGLGTVMVGAFDDGAVKKALGLPPEEIPLYIIPVGQPSR